MKDSRSAVKFVESETGYGSGEDGFVFATGDEFFPRRVDARFIETEHLMMVAVREFVQHDPGHAVIFKR